MENIQSTTKKICVTTRNERIALTLEAGKIVNSFIELGFNNRRSFVNVVLSLVSEWQSDSSKLLMLQNFWYLRVQDKEVNEKLEVVLDRVKNE